MTSIAISPEEHRARCDVLLERTQAEGLAGIVLFDPSYVLYYSGFAFVPTERPIALVLSGQGERALLVPRLELEHAQSRSTLDRVAHYDEYPGEPRAEEVLAKTLSDLGLGGKVGADQDGYPWILGYRGPTLSELTGAEVVRVAAAIEEQMAVKSEAEVAAYLGGQFERVGAVLMGRTMLDVGIEPWGDQPAFHSPVFVVTHRPAEPIERAGRHGHRNRDARAGSGGAS